MHDISFKDKLFLIKPNLFKKRNILLSIILILVILILLTCFTMIFFVKDFERDMDQKDITSRTLLVYGRDNDDFSLIDDVEHVIFNDSTKYYNPAYKDISEFDNGDAKGSVDIYPLILPDEIEIVEGRGIEHKYEAICPINFYPHNIYINENSDTMRIYPELYLSREETLGKTFVIPTSNEEYEDIAVTIVGLYNPKDNFKTINSCYISKSAFDEINSPYSVIIISGHEDGTEEIEYVGYEGNMVIVDTYENVSTVKQALEEMGFSVSETFVIGEEIITIIYTIPIFISIIIILLSINIIYIFISKKIKYRLHNYGLLKTLGYTKNTIISIDTLENIIVFLISFIISFILYLLLYFILTKTFLIEFLYNSYIIQIPILSIFFLIILFILLIILICRIKLNRILKHTAKDLLETK